jgi:hypothetical protein
MRGQSHKRSAIEASTNSIAGILTGYFSNVFLLPVFGLMVDWDTAAAMTAMFTVISIVRSYIVRRVFNWWG